jgi:hypothetical protein
MQPNKEVIIHKVELMDKLDSIIRAYYTMPSQEHLHAMRAHVQNLNSNYSSSTVQPGGKVVQVDPSEGEFLLLPNKETLHHYSFHQQVPQNSGFADSPNRFLDRNLRLDFGSRDRLNKFQKNVDPVAAISFCEITDGLRYNLSQKPAWKDILKDYTTDYFKEAGAKLAERGAEFYASVNELEALLLKYGTSSEKFVSQELKNAIKETHKEMSKKLSDLLKKYI